ncbi:MAG TPA: FAD-binding oxidoreductase [Nocardioidaceae bacterium]|nr:FAD-binding oxidoreductase [Nocardioidaceae bacterium]
MTGGATESEGPNAVGRPLWRDGHEVTHRRQALRGDVTCDIAVVGAGFTGLWTAYYLLQAEPSLHVVLLEKESAGFGASGRNGGWLSAIFPVSLPRVEKRYSHRAALDLQSAMNATVTEVGEVVKREGIDCDFAQEGLVSLARNEAQLVRARAAVEGAERFGLTGQWQLLSAGQACEKVNAAGVLGGLYTEHCAVLQPDKLVRGLAARVEAMGGVIHENTAVTRIEPGQVSTDAGGRVEASVVVRATEAFTATLAGSRRQLVPLYSLVLATEPLPEDRLAALGLDRRTAFNDLRHLRVYAQPTSEGRIVFGGRGAPYHFASKMDPAFDAHPGIHGKLVSTLHDFFPDLRGVAVTHRWGGPLGVPRDWFPSVGYDAARRTAWAGGYVGDGVATSNLSGRVLRNLILGTADPLDALPVVNHPSPRWEVEPLRWLGVNAGLRAAATADREERLTGRPSKVAALLERLTGAH